MKTNKTKPIKKIMIFTIITVMIVSLFAVPAFAVPLTEHWEEGVSNAVPYTLSVFSNSQENETVDVDLTGYYRITFDVNVLLDDVLQYSVSAVTVYPFYAPDDENAQMFGSYGYFSGAWFDGGDTSGALSLNQQDGDNAYFYFRYNSNNAGGREWEINHVYVNGVVTRNLRDFTTISFYIPSYPPASALFNTATSDFWDNAYGYYTVTHFVQQSDDPDDPIPPADGEEQGIFAVWSQITQWIVQGLASVSNAFYANGELTLLGILCIIPLAIGVAFLLIAIIQKFLRLRG